MGNLESYHLDDLWVIQMTNNLYHNIFDNDDSTLGSNYDFDIRKCSIESLMNGYTTCLKEREFEALRCRYYEMRTYSEIGKIFGLCSNRARQIVNKAERKMRYHLKTFMTVPTEDYRDLESELFCAQQMRDYYRNVFYRINSDLPDSILDNPNLQEPLGLLFGHEPVSTRLYNVLSRNKYMDKTLIDISKMTYIEVLGMHNMGSKCATELTAILNKYGLSFAREKVEEK